MPGKKDKKGERAKKSGNREGGGMASMFGFGMNTGADVSDADLEAELLALSGGAPAKGGGNSQQSGGRGMMSMDALDKMMVSVHEMGEEGEGEDMSDGDEDELLGELKALEDMETEDTPPPPDPAPKKSPAPSPRKQPPHNGNSASIAKSPSGGVGGASKSPRREGGAVGEVLERLDVYRHAIQQAEATGESSKVRRYKRGLTTLEQMLKSARAGKTVNLDDMPPPVAIKEAPPTQSKPHPPPPPAAPAKLAPKPAPKGPPPSNLIDLDDPEFDLSEEDLANMAMSLVDDRQQQPQAHSSSSVGTQQPSAVKSHSGSSVVVESHSGSSASVSHSSSRIAPPQPKPKPRSPPKPTPREAIKPRPQLHPPPMGPGGLIDLDDPMFDEFTLSDEDIAAMAAVMTDDRQTKKPRIDDIAGKPAESAHGSSQQTAPLPRVRTAPPPPQPAVPATRSLPANLKGMAASRGVTDKASLLPPLLMERRQQYQAAAGKQENPAKQREYKLIAAKFVRVQKAVESGQEVDLSQMPGPPPGYKSSYNIDLSKFSTPTPPPPPPPSSQTPKLAAPPTQGQSSSAEEEEEPDAPPNKDIPTPKTALEALEQRVAKYREGLKTAQDKGESSRVRRMGRIIKQYETAIKAMKAGKPCDYEELPAPPGYPPIPLTRRPAATVPMPTQSLPVHAMAPAAGKSLTPSISRQQILFVERRISELRQAAKMEQGQGNRDAALEYMRKVKGLSNMLVAAQGGMPVNLEQVPPSPFASLDTTKPSGEVMSHLRPAEEKDKATFELIIKQLQKQVEICGRNADTYNKMGSGGSAIEYENMSQNCQRELLALKGIQGGGFGPPKFSLETRMMTIIHSNMHLNGGVCEVEVEKVTDLTRPPKYDEKDMDVYVEVEFPYPTEAPPKKSTEVMHKTCSPEFKEQSMLFDIDRKHNRSLLRALKRMPLKCAVWQHRSLRKHIFIGQVSVPLDALETKSEIHCTLDLLDERGRKPVGGKMDVFVRLREPLTGRDQEECEEQWLVFKESIAAKSAVPMPKLAAKTPPKKQGAAGGPTPNYSLLSPVKAESTTSVAALKFELSLVTSAIKGGHKDSQTIQKGKLVKARMDSIQQRLQTDPNFKRAYPKQVAKEIHQEQLLEAQLEKQGKSKQAEVVILQKRRAAMEKEIKTT